MENSKSPLRFIPILVSFADQLHHKQSSNMSRNAETQTPDWSKNNDAYFAGSLEITSNDTFAAVKGKGAPPKGILVQTDLNLPLPRGQP